MTKQKVNIVWFKRDLRLQDHAPLKAACDDSLPVILLYCFEPRIMQNPDADVRHWRFVWQSLVDMQQSLKQESEGKLQVAYANAVDVFSLLHKQFDIQNVFSHQETGNRITYERDISLSHFFGANNICWKEFQTNGIIRKLSNRNTWNKRWQEVMESPLSTVAISRLTFAVATFPNAWSVRNLEPGIRTAHAHFQSGGETEAHKTLRSFLNARVGFYMKHISKPEESRTSCSRLSPHLAWGNLSIRQVYQSCIQTMQQGKYEKPLAFFIARLHWHCHFIQKFETECSIEHTNLNKAFDTIRTEKNEPFYQAWAAGKTGYPLIDACMHCLKETGYINFRMRAMLVSFLTHNLWQHWNSGAHHLARYFLDYEPGIHYPQLQMQAGTMGVNTIRTYNPVKQSKDHDPDGSFIKQWIPALRSVPQTLIHEPWKMTLGEQSFYSCIIGKDFPFPIIDLGVSSRESNKKLWSLKRSDQALEENKMILDKLTHRNSEIDNEPTVKKQRKSKRNTVNSNLKLF